MTKLVEICKNIIPMDFAFKSVIIIIIIIASRDDDGG